MNYFISLVELGCLLFISQLLGRRITDLLPSVIKRKIGFYIAPILGLAFLVLLSTLYGWLSPFKSKISITLVSILVILSWVFEYRKREWARHSLYVGLFAIVCSLPILAPIILYGGYNPFTDIFTYLAQAQWLQQHGFAEKVITSGHHPLWTQVELYQATGSRMGGSFFLGFVQSLFNLSWSYYAYIPTVALAFVSGCLAIGGIIRQVIPIKRVVVLALALLPSLSMNGFSYGAEWGFYPQTLGLAFAVGVGALFPFLTAVIAGLVNSSSFPAQLTATRSRHLTRQQSLNKWLSFVWKIFGYTLPLSICSSALLFAYNEPFPIFVIAIGLFVVITMIISYREPYQNKLRGSFQRKILSIYLFFYFLQLLALVNYEAVRIIKNVYQTLTISKGFAAIGWPVLWLPIQFMASSFGMKSYFTHGLYTVDSLISIVLFPLIFIVILGVLFEFIRIKPKRREALIFLLCFELVFVLFFCKFRYLSVSQSGMEIGHTFLQFKISKYAAPYSMALFAIAIGICWHYLKSYRRMLVLIYMVIMLSGLIYHENFIAKNFTNHFLSSVKRRVDPFGVLLNLREALTNIPANQVIHLKLGSDQSKLRQMVSYVLYDRKLSSDYRDDGYIVGRLPNEDRVMSFEKADKLIIMKQPQDTNDNQNLISGPFLIQSKPFHFTLPQGQVGGYGTEFNDMGDSWNWVQHEINFSFQIIGHPKFVRFKFTLKAYDKAQTLYIQIKTNTGVILSSDTIHSLEGERSFTSPWVKPDEIDQLILHVEADGEPVKLGVFDKRRVTFMIMNTTILTKM